MLDDERQQLRVSFKQEASIRRLSLTTNVCTEQREEFKSMGNVSQNPNRGLSQNSSRLSRILLVFTKGSKEMTLLI